MCYQDLDERQIKIPEHARRAENSQRAGMFLWFYACHPNFPSPFPLAAWPARRCGIMRAEDIGSPGGEPMAQAGSPGGIGTIIDRI